MTTPEEALNYPSTERTRFTVHIEIHPGRDGCVPGKITLAHLRSLTDAQLAYAAIREESWLGGSQFGDGLVYDEMGQNIARISYNGRIWGPLPWHPKAQPVGEAPALDAPAPQFGAAFTPAPFLTEGL